MPRTGKSALLTALAGSLMAILAGRYARATPVKPLDIAALADGADLIVVGQILSLNPHGTAMIEVSGISVTGTSETAVLEVHQVLKGALPTSKLPFDFLVPDTPAPVQGVPLNAYGIFFLQQNGAAIRVFDPTYAFLPALPDAQVAVGAPIEMVTNALIQVLDSPRASDRDGLWALNTLEGVRSKLASDGLEGALRSRSGELQLRIAARLLARNNLAGLEIVTDALSHPSGLPDQLVSELGGSLAGIHNPDASPKLATLIDSKSPSVRLGAAIALRQSHSPTALAALAQALDDSNPLIRYYAVVGMGEITGQAEWTPAHDEFRANEDKYLVHWRDWAAANLPQDAEK